MEVLTIISWIFLAIGLVSCVIVYLDVNLGRYQAMPIMNLAWVITSIYMGIIGLFMYFRYGRASGKPMVHEMHHDHAAMKGGCEHHMMKPKPMWVQVFISSTHCGAGCGLADIVSELLIYFAGITFWGASIWASFFIDYGFAVVFGLAFQYLNIKPMKPDTPAWQVFWDAVKADILSLTSFQVGMYAWMLAIYFIFHGQVLADSAFYWFNIQIGLILGLFTTYPVNYLLIKTGVKVPCAH